jgi:uncharacterized membrane protein
MSDAALVAWFRRFLLLAAVAICAGVIAELWLTGHTDEPLQWVPFIVCGLGIVLLLAVMARPQRNVLRAMQALMIVMAIAGAVGAVLHLRGNLELAQETKPALAQSQPLWMALAGHNPALAPGALGVTALIALAATFRHPALQKATAESRIVVNNRA